MQDVAWIVLLFAVVSIAAFIYRDIKEYPHFKSLTKTEERQKMYKQWLVLSFSIFGVGGLLGLWVIGHPDCYLELHIIIKDGRG